MLYSSIPTSSMVFVRKSVTRLPLVPYRANVTMLQDSLYVTDCYFAPVSHRHTSLQHSRSPKSIGGSLQGSLAINLVPDFHWQADNSLQNTQLSSISDVRRNGATQKTDGNYQSPPVFFRTLLIFSYLYTNPGIGSILN